MPASNPNVINYANPFPTNTPGSHIPGAGNAGSNSSVLNTPFTTNIGMSGPSAAVGVNTGTGVAPTRGYGGTTTSTIPVPPNVGKEFTANGTSTNPLDLSSFGNITGNDKDLANKLNHLFGGGMGATILQMLQTGGFSQADAQAFINAMLPQEARGRESVLNSFGNLGLRDSSSAEIGLGDFESQFASQEMATLAGMREQAINRSFGLLGQIMPTAAGEKANEMSTWDMIQMGLQMAAGVATGVPAIGALGGGAVGAAGGAISAGLGGGASRAAQTVAAPSTAPNDYGITTGGVPFSIDDWSAGTMDPFGGDFNSTPGII